MNSTQSIEQPAITFYGAGSMAEAIVRGLVNRALFEPSQIAMFNRSNNERLTYLNGRYGVSVLAIAEHKEAALQHSPIIVLAIKPKDAAEALRSLGPILRDNQLIISLVAGLSIKSIQTLLGRKQPIARSMPNTSSSIGYGATGISYSPEVTEELSQQTLAIFEAVGTVSIIPESQMDILTAVSGSGPAYIYYMMESMIEAGIEGGLTAEQARQLTVQTVLGAASMMSQTDEEPAALRKAITSPNGVTQEAIAVLEKTGFPSSVKAAVHRAAERSHEIGASLEEGLS